jgi:hypothetical protein
VTLELGLTDTNYKNLHRVEAFDYDLDGDDDILYCRNGAPRDMQVIRNNIGQDNNWTGVQLYAPEGVNGSSIGARVYVWSGGVQRMREVYAGRGNGAGQQPFKLLFGLGSNGSIDSIKVVWPDKSGSVTTVYNPPMKTYLGITKNGLKVADNGGRQADEGVVLYPNPGRDYLLIHWKGVQGKVRLEVQDMMGRRLSKPWEYYHASGTIYYSIKDLPPGQYLLRGEAAQGKVFSAVFLKK